MDEYFEENQRLLGNQLDFLGKLLLFLGFNFLSFILVFNTLNLCVSIHEFDFSIISRKNN
jgi:hypothetical protein